MDAMNKRIENYLKKNFPRKTITKCLKIVDEKAELYGINSMKILVLEKPTEVSWELLK